ncbi:MAG: hypothetical protein WBD40_16320 [Tepidisphaeraceae bacterium]
MTLNQRIGLFSRQTLSILEDKIVRRHRGIGQETEDAYQFIELDENPIRVRRIAWAWFVVSGLSMVAAAACLHAAWRATGDVEGMYAVMAICLILAGGTLYGAFRRTLHIVVFASARGPLVIQNSRPGRDECREFIRLLQQKIAESRSVENRVTRTVLTILRSEDLLDDWKYQKACERFNVRDDA